MTSTTGYVGSSSSSSGTTGTNTAGSSTVVGINSQPYRSYLTDRNHFYHSASQPTSTLNQPTLASTAASTFTTTHLTKSSLVSSNPATTTNTGANQSSSSASANQNKYGSRQSLSSQSSQQANRHHHQHSSSAHHHSHNMKASNNKRSISSVDGGLYKDDMDDEDYDLYQPSACTRFFYGLLYLLAQVGLWGSVSVFLYWIFKYDRGFAYQQDKGKMFNLHAFLMMTGFIFVNGQSMLIYKTYTCCKRIYNKITHAFFFILSLTLVAFGMLIIIQAQHIQDPQRPDQTPVHFYSLHSWIGLVTCALFGLQFLFGFITFLVLLCCDRATASYRARFLPIHVTFGVVIFLLATATCLSGLLQMARARLTPGDKTSLTPDYQDMRLPENYNIFMNPGLVINTVGGCLILLAVLIPYLVRNFNHRQESASFRVNH